MVPLQKYIHCSARPSASLRLLKKIVVQLINAKNLNLLINLHLEWLIKI